MKSIQLAAFGGCLLLGACSGGADNGGSTGGDAGAGGSVVSIGGGSSAGSLGSAGSLVSGGSFSQGGSLAAGGGAAAGGAVAAGGSVNDGGAGGGQAGADASGGSSAAGGTAGAAASGGGSAGGSNASIDFSIWVLQLPTGSGNSPTTISSSQLKSGYTSAYFYKADDGGQAFMDPATGITTSGSQHCRTEMRESTASGGEAAWASSGTNSMTVKGKVIKVGGGNSGTVTVGQLFNGTDSIPLIELEYSVSAGGFKMLYEEAKGGGTTTNLNTPVALGSAYTFTLALTKGVATVTINDKVVHTQTPSAAALAKQFYFKFGNYDQTAAAGAISTTPYTVVESYSVEVVHR